MTKAEMEARLLALERQATELRNRLEREVTELRNRLDGKPPGWRWWVEGAGEFANDPVFDEIVRLGKEYRKSVDRKPRKKVKRDRA